MSSRACTISLLSPVAGGSESHGRLVVPEDGTVLITLTSPRPLRLWIGSLQVLDEDLWWRRYERHLEALVVVPLPAGDHPLRARYGERSGWPSAIDHECASRNRERVRQGLISRFPDRFDVTAEVQPQAAAVACSLRFLPAQCVEDGVTYQHVLARPIAGWRGDAPSTASDRPGERPSWLPALRSALAPYLVRDASDQADRDAGLRRLLVPVANATDPLPLARADAGTDDRLEPECITVRRNAITIEPSLERILGGNRNEEPLDRRHCAAVVASMPAFEARGRLAPRREYHPVRWPDEDSILATVPKASLPPEERGFGALADHAWRMLRRLRRTADPRSGLPNDYIGTARDGFLNEMFVWDSSFTAMCSAWGWRIFPATATLDCLYSRQMDGGYLHRETNTQEGIAVGFEPDFSPNPPITAIAEWKLASLTGDTARLASVYRALAAQHGWLQRNRRLADGTYWTTGLANGLDNSPSLGDGYPDLTAQQAQAAEILSLIAEIGGDQDAAAAWQEERQRVGRAMNERLWSPELAFFSSSLPGGGHNPNKVVTGFWPLWTGLVAADRVACLERHLLDPASFWRHHPIPSLAADSPHYRPGGDYWLGSTWAPTNAAAIWGFARAGRYDLARRILRRHLAVMAEVFAATGVIWENYCAERSEKGSWSGPDYSWTALGPIALLNEVLIGIEPDALHDRIRWVLPDSPGYGLDRIPLGPATINLHFQAGRRLSVSTDRAFSLQVQEGGVQRERRIPAGRWTLSIDDLPMA